MQPSGKAVVPTRARRVNHGGAGRKRGARPVPAAAEALGLRRGTDEYREWEAERVLDLLATGHPPRAIRLALGMTKEEYRAARVAPRERREPVDGAIAWAQFEAGLRRRVADAERILAEAIQDKDRRTQAAMLKFLHDAHVDTLRLGIDLGIVGKVIPDGPPEGAAASGHAPLSAHATFLVGILEQAGARTNLEALTPEQTVDALRRVTAEFTALRDRPRPPSLTAGAP